MNAYMKYRRQEESTNWTRMDLLIALYDKALERLDRAEASLKADDTPAAITQIAKTQLILNELAAGVRIDVNPEVNVNILRLYEYTTTELSKATVEGIANGRVILKELRAGFDAVRAEANEMERTGKIPPLAQLQMVSATA